jgi:hypothetical protein
LEKDYVGPEQLHDSKHAGEVITYYRMLVEAGIQYFGVEMLAAAGEDTIQLLADLERFRISSALRSRGLFSRRCADGKVADGERASRNY